MKKITIVTALLASLMSTQVMAEESIWYVGAEYFTGQTEVDVSGTGVNDFKNTEDLDGFKIKVGVAVEDGWRVQGYYKNEDVDTFANNVNGIGVDVIKGFAITDKFSPFIKGGLGYDWMEIDAEPGVNYDEDNIYAISLTLGVGAFYKITDNFELEAGVDYQYRTWQDIEVYGFGRHYTIETEDSGFKFLIGANYHF